MISYLLPTRNRPEALAETLHALGELSAHAHDRVGGAEVIVVDNHSDPPVELPDALANGMPLRLVRQDANLGAAARNSAAAVARGEWLIMLDDDSQPLDVNHLWVITEAPEEVAAIGAEIRLSDGGREDGGLPEVFVGCGVAIRREAFMEVDGYDPAFGFYAEEYDLCAKLMLGGWRITHDLGFRVLHRKVDEGRDKNRILRHLVRNNGWVMHRYAPRKRLAGAVHMVMNRYRAIAKREGAMDGFERGCLELEATIDEQPRELMKPDVFDCFTGLAHVRETLAHTSVLTNRTLAAVVDEGKQAWAVHQVLDEMQIPVVSERKANALVLGTLSLGPMLDAWDRRRDAGPAPVILPWIPQGLTTRQYAASHA